MEKMKNRVAQAAWLAAWVSLLVLPVLGFAQGPAQDGASSDSLQAAAPKKTYLEVQKERLDAQLKRRIESMKKRFAAEQGFHVQVQERRIAFEKALAVEKKAFLDKAEGLKGDEKDKAWDAFYSKQRSERRVFNAQLREESSKFWDELRSQEN